MESIMATETVKRRMPEQALWASALISVVSYLAAAAAGFWRH